MLVADKDVSLDGVRLPGDVLEPEDRTSWRSAQAATTRFPLRAP